MQNVVTRLGLICLLSGSGLVGAQQSKGDAASMPRVFEVASIAYRTFESQLKSGETTIEDMPSEAQQWRSDIRNYNIEIMEYDGKIDVTFSLRSFKDLKFNEGVYHYVLNETTGEILDKTADR